jgi:hypothetical protein
MKGFLPFFGSLGRSGWNLNFARMYRKLVSVGMFGLLGSFKSASQAF